MRRLVVGLLVLAALALAASGASAQFRFGAGGAWGSDSELGIGARFLLGLPAIIADRPVTGQLSGEWYVDACDFDCNHFEITPAAFIPFSGARFTPFAGAGLNLSHTSVDTPFDEEDATDTDLGLALLGGFFVPLGSMTGQGEARITIGGSEQLVLSFNLLFGQR